MERPVVILVQRSRRPRRWAGVAMFAAVLIAVLYIEHRQVTDSSPVGMSNIAPRLQDSFESVLQFEPADHSAQLTDLAFNNSTSTDGATPKR